MFEKVIHVEELHAKNERGETTKHLAPGEAFIIKDTIGFEKFKILMGAEGEDAKMYLNGVQVLQ